jgi:hypothetical protein
VARPIFSVDEQNIGETVIVVIDESATRAHGFRQPFFAECPVVMSEVNAGLRRDIAKRNGLRPREKTRSHNQS